MCGWAVFTPSPTSMHLKGQQMPAALPMHQPNPSCAPAVTLAPCSFVARHFLGSLSPDCVYKKSKASFAAGSETFTTSGTTVVRPGFTVSSPRAQGCATMGLSTMCHHVPVLPCGHFENCL